MVGGVHGAIGGERGAAATTGELCPLDIGGVSGAGLVGGVQGAAAGNSSMDFFAKDA